MQRISAPAIALIFLAIAMWFTAGANGELWFSAEAAVDCVGKAYGHPGCPTRPATSAGSSASSSRHCGNSILDEGEQCDNGRFNGKTGCSNDCKILYCGDGIVTRDIKEECDPIREEYYVLDKNGNLTTEIRFAAPPSCGWYCKPPECTATACSGGCQLKFIGECPKSSVQASSSAGQSSAESGSGKGISVSSGSTAQVASMSASSSSFTSSARAAACGDGVRQEKEECDDGNKNNADGCSNACGLSRCGDGIVQKREECDKGKENSDVSAAACRTNCMIARCGDGVADKGEACDDGNRSDLDGCTNACKPPACGDGAVQKGEECDWGAKNSNTQPDACRVSCRKPMCGDKVVDRGEMCDPPGRRPDLAAANALCSRDCKFAPLPAATVSAVPADKGRGKSSKKYAGDGGDNAVSGIADTALPAAIGATAIVIIGSSVFLLRKAVSIFRRRNSK